MSLDLCMHAEKQTELHVTPNMYIFFRSYKLITFKATTTRYVRMLTGNESYYFPRFEYFIFRESSKDSLNSSDEEWSEVDIDLNICHFLLVIRK